MDAEHFDSELERARALVAIGHEMVQYLLRLRTSGKIEPKHLAPMLAKAQEGLMWSRFILNDVMASETRAERDRLKEQVKRLKRKLAHATAA